MQLGTAGDHCDERPGLHRPGGNLPRGRHGADVTFDNVSTTGNVVPAGPFSAWEIINTTQNDPAPLYVAIEDKAGKMAMVTNANPAAVNTTVMDLWRIPMSAFAGVDLKNAAKLYIGVGDGKADGSGVMNFADVRIIKPVVSPDPNAIDVTMKGDALKGFPDYAGAWPAAEVPANTIDDSITDEVPELRWQSAAPVGILRHAGDRRPPWSRA